jgi:hypothetical protein
MLTLNAGTRRFARGQAKDGSFVQAQVPLSSDNVINYVGTTGTIGKDGDETDVLSGGHVLARSLDPRIDPE